MVTMIPSLTPFTCALACIESYFADVGHNVDQCEMLKKYPQYLTNSDPGQRHTYGATTDPGIIALCRDEGFQANGFQDFTQSKIDLVFQECLKTGAGVLITCKWEEREEHCVRLANFRGPGLYDVMNPLHLNAVRSQVTFNELVAWNFRLIVVTR